MRTEPGTFRVAVIGAGPAGIFAADALVNGHETVHVDVIDRLPVPFGLIRYGVAPDHPRIRGIEKSLAKVLSHPRVRFVGNVDFGVDITWADLAEHYSAWIFATGADTDRASAIPGAGADGDHGSADFVAWYNAHPDAPGRWPLNAETVGVIGVGNVALDIIRVLAKPADLFLETDVAGHVHEQLRTNRVRVIDVFGRRGPAQAKFSPMELRELMETPGVRVVVDPDDLQFDEASVAAREGSKITDTMVSLLETAAAATAGDADETGNVTVRIHFLEEPIEVVSSSGRVVGLRTRRQALEGNGSTVTTGQETVWPIEALYRAAGYASRALPGVPFDPATNIIPNAQGRVLDEAGGVIPRAYATGWVKRGPVGLIGHTKSDSVETVNSLLEDLSADVPYRNRARADLTDTLRSGGHATTDWDGWLRISDREEASAVAVGRKRVRVWTRQEMLEAAQAGVRAAAATPGH